MRCLKHPEAEAIALCRICSVCLCGNCAIRASQGYVCSDECKVRAATIDSVLALQHRNLVAKDRVLSWFVLPAGLIVLGSMLICERLLFGQTPSTVKVLVGFGLLLGGVTYFLYVLFLKKTDRGDA